MKVVGFAAYSGSGKTTLLERLIPALRQRGQRVSVLKHAHHKFDIDQPGKDTWRHRQAGAFEVLAVSSQRLALMREFEQPTQLNVHQLLAELCGDVDWVLVEGFKHSDLPRIEVWRGAAVPLLYPNDAGVVALAMPAALALPQPLPPHCQRLDLDRPEALADWLLQQAPRFEYPAWQQAAAPGAKALDADGAALPPMSAAKRP